MFKSETPLCVRLYECTTVRVYDCTIVRLYDCTSGGDGTGAKSPEGGGFIYKSTLFYRGMGGLARLVERLPR